MMKPFLAILVSIALNLCGYSQELDVLDLVQSKVLIENGVKQINVYSVKDSNQKVIHERLFINPQGQLDSSFRFSHLDTNQVISLQRYFYNEQSEISKAIFGVRLYDFSTEPPSHKKELTYRVATYEYSEGLLVRKKFEISELSSTDLIVYQYRDYSLIKQYEINTTVSDTESVVHYKNLGQNQELITREKDGSLSYFELLLYDNNGNLIQKHTKNTNPRDRLVFGDSYYTYDSNHNRLKWTRFDGANDAVVYEYFYNQQGLLIRHKSPFGKKIIEYN